MVREIRPSKLLLRSYWRVVDWKDSDVRELRLLFVKFLIFELTNPKGPVKFGI